VRLPTNASSKQLTRSLREARTRRRSSSTSCIEAVSADLSHGHACDSWSSRSCIITEFRGWSRGAVRRGAARRGAERKVREQARVGGPGFTYSERRKVPVQSSVFGSVPPHIDARAAVFLLTPLHTPLGQSLDDHCAGRGRTCPAAAITIRRRSGGARASRGASCRTDEATCLGENHRCRSTWLAMKSKRVLPRVTGTRAARIAARIHQSVGRSSLDRAPSSTTVARDDRCRRA